MCNIGVLTCHSDEIVPISKMIFTYSQGMYFVSSVLLMRMNMPEEYRYGILFVPLYASLYNTMSRQPLCPLITNSVFYY